MKTSIVYHVITIPKKLKMEIKLIVEDNKSEYINSSGEDTFATIRLFPMITLGIVREVQRDDTGLIIKQPFVLSDTLTMSRYTLAIFKSEFEDIFRLIKEKDVYTYHGKRLELNEKIVEEIRKVFKISRNVVEIMPTLLISPDDMDEKIEGVKLKFNNENSSVLLSINDMIALIETMNNISIDTITTWMYKEFKNAKPGTYPPASFKEIDIIPKAIV